MLSDSLEDVYEVGVNIDTVEPTSHDQALHDADLLRTQLGPTEIPVFSARRDDAQCALQMVGIQPSIGIGEKHLQAQPPLAHVVKRLCKGRWSGVGPNSPFFFRISVNCVPR